MRRRDFLLAGAAAGMASMTMGLAGRPAQAAPSAELWDRWTAHDEAATTVIDHGAWAAFLNSHVRPDGDGINRVPYGRISGTDRSLLTGYLDTLMAVPISRYKRAEQQAYWVNLYNALTVQVILDHYPVESIRDIDISPGLFADGPWGKALFVVEGEELSLDDIEHRILRPIWRDPRIHYAVNCASIGCPNLLATPFTAANSEALLERGARSYINHPRGVRVEGDEALASSIYFWFQEDFGDSDEGVLAHLKHYATAPLAKDLAAVSDLENGGYDWTLNDATQGQAQSGQGETVSRPVVRTGSGSRR